MRFPVLNDTIVACSTAAGPAPLGIVRLSGPGAFALARPVLTREPPDSCPASNQDRIRLNGLEVPARVTWFRGPASYTSQDVIEVSTIGNPALLGALQQEFVRCGARVAQPGEFTARAFLAGKIRVSDVEEIEGRIAADDGAEAQRRRREGQRIRENTAAIQQRLLDLLSRVEAGIDFADEDDVRFLSGEQARAAVAELRRLATELQADVGAAERATRPHVLLVGKPNAGKSSLFNRLLESERAIVAAESGTTRDVVSGTLDLEGLGCVLQDSAGVGDPVGEIDRSAEEQRARRAQIADLVLFVHDAGLSWDTEEVRLFDSFAAERVLLVNSKIDQYGNDADRSGVWVSASTGFGVDQLRSTLRERLSRMHSEQGRLAGCMAALEAGMKRVDELLSASESDLRHPELISLELVQMVKSLEEAETGQLAESVLERIFERFCIGK